MTTIKAYASEDAHVIYGAAYDDSLGEDIRVTVVATGLSRPGARRQAMSVVQGGLRTGTDNMTLVGTPTASMNAALAGGNPVAAAPVGCRRCLWQRRCLDLQRLGL